MIITGIIPARYASTRFPGKPLVDINGKSMIQRVVATDDLRIAEHVKQFGGKVMLTSDQHQSGTDRCAEVLEKTETPFQAVINIQGDEPFISPEQITQLCELIKKGADLATLVKEIRSEEDLFNPNIPKVVISADFEALYFSRSTIPHIRNIDGKQWLNHHTFFKHIGLYGYTTEALLKIKRMSPSPLEKAEMLEQLRWLENGLKIKVAVTQHETHAIDTPEDLQRVMDKLKGDNFVS
jgi:3-deoxy-manno-octulosonate cytidylyltransferase (CMP-KDO synthetase)